jgi:heme/copper-type cytochrome/quinol oxidase subunit 2
MGTEICVSPETRMQRYVSSIFFLLVVIAWLVFSYWTPPGLSLPRIGFSWENSSALFQTTTVIWLAIFLLVQGMLVVTTIAAIRNRQQQAEGQANDSEAAEETSAFRFDLNISRELVWTAMPLAMTIILAAIAYLTWRSI